MTRTLLLLATLAALSSAADVQPGKTVVIDGSSTVYPITVAVGERFAAQNPQARIELLCSGSTAGFRRLVAGEIPISGASRPIKADELAKAAKKGIELIELPVAFDGLSVVVNKRNSFIDHLTVQELKRLWEPDSAIKTWRQLRAGWPDAPVSLFGPGRDSGTFDYFTETIVGTARASRSDFTGSEDDNVLVQGVVRSENALGYFGLAYYHENESMLRAIPIDSGNGPVMPSIETVANGSYRPLSRPLFLYVNKAALAEPEVKQFVEGYLRLVPKTAAEVGYVALSDRVYQLVWQRFTQQITGSVFATAKEGARIEDLLTSQDQTVVAPKPAAIPPVTVTAKPTSAPVTVSAPVTTPPAPVAAAPAAPAATAAKPQTAAPAIPNASAVAKTTTPVRPTTPPTSLNVAAATIPPATAPVIPAARLNQLRDRALALARLTMDDRTTISELERSEKEFRELIHELSLTTSTTIDDSAVNKTRTSP